MDIREEESFFCLGTTRHKYMADSGAADPVGEKTNKNQKSKQKKWN